MLRALNAHVAAFLAPAVLRLFWATFTHVESPTNWVALVIKLVVAFQLIWTIGLGLGRRPSLLLWIDRSAAHALDQLRPRKHW